ncbi:unnamed protein product, partial [Musa textilis]
MHIMILLPNPNKARHMGTRRGRNGCNMFSSLNSQHLKMLTEKLKTGIISEDAITPRQNYMWLMGSTSPIRILPVEETSK